MKKFIITAACFLFTSSSLAFANVAEGYKPDDSQQQNYVYEESSQIENTVKTSGGGLPTLVCPDGFAMKGSTGGVPECEPISNQFLMSVYGKGVLFLGAVSYSSTQGGGCPKGSTLVHANFLASLTGQNDGAAVSVCKVN